MFDPLFLETENIIYKIPVIEEVYNLHKLGANTLNQINNFSSREANEVLKEIVIPVNAPDITLPLTLKDIVSIKNQGKKVAEKSEHIAKQVESYDFII